MPNDFDTSTYPLGSTHPYVLYNNAGNEDLFVNDIVNETWVDRPPFNRVRKTLFGMEQQFLRALAKMGYETTYLTYVDGTPLQVDRPTQLIARGGAFYAVKMPTNFPVILTGTWATDAPLLTDVGDQGLRTQLALGTGAGLSGFDRSLTYATGTVGRGIQESALGEYDAGAVYPTGTVGSALQTAIMGPLAAYRPLGDSSGAALSSRYATLADAQAFYPHVTSLTQTIDWAAIQGYLNSGAAELDIPAGDYVVGNDDLVQSGGGISLTTSVKSTFRFGLNKQLKVTGAIVAQPALSADVVARATSFVCVSAPTLSKGDTLCLYDRRDYSWSQHRSYYRAGEFVTVASVSGNTVSIYGGLRYGYGAANIDIYKVTGKQVKINGFRAIGDPASVVAAIKVTFCVDVQADSIATSATSSGYGIEVDRCLGGSVTRSAIKSTLSGLDDYGVLISNSTGIQVNVDSFVGRHAVALGGGGAVCNIPCRDTIVWNSRLFNSDPAVGAGDAHGICDGTKYVNCIMDHHFNMAGKDTRLQGCKIFSRPIFAGYPDGSAVFGSEIIGGNYDILDCELIINGDMSSFGGICFVPTMALKYDLNITIRNLTVRGTVQGSTSKLVKVSCMVGETLKTNVVMTGINCDLDQLFTYLWVRCEGLTSQVVPSKGHTVMVDRGPSGATPIYVTPGITGIPTRVQSPPV